MNNNSTESNKYPDIYKQKENADKQILLLASMNAVPGLAILFNTDRRVVITNNRFKKAFESDSKAQFGKHPGDLFLCTNLLIATHGCGSSEACQFCKINTSIHQAFTQDEAIELETEMVTQSSQIISLEVIANKITFDSDEFVLVTMRDTSAKVKLLRETEQLQRTAFQMLQINSLGALAAGIAHEINNPLAIIAGNLNQLEKAFTTYPDANFAPTVEKTKTAALRIANIVKKLVYFCETEKPNLSKFNIYEEVDFLYNIFKANPDYFHIKFSYIPEYKQIMIMGHQTHFKSALMNIILNATEACHKAKRHGASISIKVDQKDNFLIVSVQDNGIGISKTELDLISMPFVTTKSPDQGIGLGLGLTTTYKIIENMGGKVTIESTENLGTTVFLHIPVVTE